MIINYIGQNRVPAHCDVKVFEGQGEWEGQEVVLITDLESNEGVYAVNFITHLSKGLTERFNLKNPLWLTHFQGERWYTRAVIGEEVEWLNVDIDVFKRNTLWKSM